MKITIMENVLGANQRLADENRDILRRKNIYAVNLMSSPGAGKTTLVEKTIGHLKDRYRIAVIEGDVQDCFDADRIRNLDIPVEQINTGGGCHIDGYQIKNALTRFDLDNLDLLIIENVGNLVCPAQFDLGAHSNVTILSTPEGAEKPAKYPQIFQSSAVMLLNKIDLLPYVDFDRERAFRYARGLNPRIRICEISCRTGQGLEDWFGWLENEIEGYRTA